MSDENADDCLIVLELWNHGAAGETDESCGEICIFNITGARIPLELLEALSDKDKHNNTFDWYDDLPTEQPLKVEAEINYEEEYGSYWLSLKSWEALPTPPTNED